MENRARRQSRNNEFWLILKKMDNSARYYSDLGPLQVVWELSDWTQATNKSW